jgi:hypothetical protein
MLLLMETLSIVLQVSRQIAPGILGWLPRQRAYSFSHCVKSFRGSEP